MGVVEFKIASDKPLQKLLAEVEQLGVQNARLWTKNECLAPESPISAMFGHVITLKGSVNGEDFALPLNGGWRVEKGDSNSVDLTGWLTQITMVVCVVFAGFALQLQLSSKPWTRESTFGRLWEIATDPNTSFKEKLEQKIK